MHNLHTKKYNLITTSIVTKRLLQSFLTASLLCCSACGDQKISMEEVEEKIKEKTQSLEEENKTLKDKVTTLENNQPAPTDATTVAANLKKITDVLGEDAENIQTVLTTLGISDTDFASLKATGILPTIYKAIGIEEDGTWNTAISGSITGHIYNGIGFNPNNPYKTSEIRGNWFNYFLTIQAKIKQAIGIKQDGTLDSTIPNSLAAKIKNLENTKQDK